MYEPAPPVIARAVNVTRPVASVASWALESAAPATPTLIVAVTVVPAVGTRFANASSITTTGCTANGTPDAAFDDGAVRTRTLAAAAGTTVKRLLAASASPVVLATMERPAAMRSTRRSPKVAMPLTAVAVVVPMSVAPAPLVASASETVPVNPVATLPNASRSVTVSAGAIVVPATTFAATVPSCRVCAAEETTLKVGVVAVSAPLPKMSV